MELNNIRELTFKYGGDWGINHVDRLLKLVEIIGENQEYDKQLIWIAAHLHDWGAYNQYIEEGKDHAIRSREVSEEILKQLNIDEKKQKTVLDMISEHNSSGDCSSIESTLLRDADFLDFLGIIGIVRELAKGPKDLKKGMESIKKRMGLFSNLILPKSIEIGKERLEEMNFIIERMESESFGFY